MEQALIKLDGLSETLSANRSLTERAKLAVTCKMDEFNKLDLSILDDVTGNAKEQELNGLLNKIDSTLELNHNRRKPFTQKMDEVKKIFTSDEAEIKQLSELVKDGIKKWSAEKMRRNRIADEEKERKLAKENAKVDYRRHVTEQINLRYLQMVAKLKKRMTDKFFSLKGEELEAYKKTLESYKPAMVIPDYGATDHPLLSEEEMKSIRQSTEKDIFNALADDFTDQMETCKQDLISGQDAANIEEKQLIEEQKAKDEMESKAKSDAEIAKMNNTLDASAVAPVSELGKGVSVKIKYAPKDHQQVVKIVQYWVANVMNTMTVSELTKKLSFMFTAANSALNKGEKIEGIDTVEDIFKRKTK